MGVYMDGGKWAFNYTETYVRSWKAKTKEYAEEEPFPPSWGLEIKMFDGWLFALRNSEGWPFAETPHDGGAARSRPETASTKPLKRSAPTWVPTARTKRHEQN